MRRRRGRITAASTNWWLGAGYGGLLGFFVLEKVFRQPGGASSLNASEDDHGTTRLIIAAYALGTDLPLVTRRLSIGQLPGPVAPAGLAIQAGGLALRAWSMHTLGGFYTRTLRTDRDQQNLVDTGPYRLARHPGYLGSILTWSGFALTRAAPRRWLWSPACSALPTPGGSTPKSGSARARSSQLPAIR